MKRVLLILLALVLVAAVPACGGEEDESATPETVEGTSTEDTGGGAAEGDAENGKAVFASAGCGGCHTLADAGSSGSTGPNLDDLQPAAEDVAAQVENGGGGMPSFKDRLSEQEIQDVAAYVSSVAGG